ncbi:MAG: efflux RND transporter periplasmic adaptor subunit [Bacteroidota bacterium]|nr:efflux RND transporter periplasmic adaptor subunit [Bacteroidota bacterium]
MNSSFRNPIKNVFQSPSSSTRWSMLFVVLVFSLTLHNCSSDEMESSEPEELIKMVNVETEVLSSEPFNSFLRLVGTVETSDDVQLSAEVSGKVFMHVVSEGQKVQKGQTILRIDDAKLSQEVARLEAVVAQYETTWKRVQTLYEEENIGSEIDYLNAKYAYDQNKSALSSLSVDLENTEIIAPFTGVVETIFVEEGEMVAPGMPAIRLIGANQFVISAGVPARYANVVELGDRVDVWFDTQVQDTLAGTIVYVANSIDPSNRTFKIDIRLPSGKTYYKVDMIANLRLNTLSLNQAVVVSEEFVYSKGEGYVMYVKGTNSEGKDIALERKVELGPSFKTEVVISRGLAPGDEIITIGSAFLNDRVRINVVNSTGPVFALD